MVAFSVIIPTYNRPGPLARCLSAIAAMDYPRECFAVIVVDDGGTSTPATEQVVSRFRSMLDVRVLRQANAGPASARNTGAAAARHRFLAFTDDDCAPRPGWLRTLAALLIADGDVLVGGQCMNALPRNPYATASQTILDVVNAHFNADPRHAVFFPSNNMAMARDRFLEVGGFDPSFRCSEDRDLCDRWSARGWRLALCPQAVVDHSHAMGMVGFCRQHFGYGRGAWRFHRSRERRGTGRLEVAGNFYVKCFAEPFRTQPPHRAIPVAVLLGVWQVANLAGFAFEAARETGRGGNGKARSPAMHAGSGR